MTAASERAEQQKRGIAAVFGSSAATYDQVGVDFFTPMGRDLVALAGLQPGAHVLDVGCGRGAVLFPAAEGVGPTGRVTGIDLAPAMVELTAAEARARGLTHVHVVVGDAEQPDLPDLPDGSVDVVLAGLVLFFLPDPGAALRSLRPAAAPGGPPRLHHLRRRRPALRGGHARGRRVRPRRRARSAEIGRDRSARSRASPTCSPPTGFAVSHTEDRAYVSRFTDPDHMLAWAWSHGGRAVLGRVPESDLAAAGDGREGGLRRRAHPGRRLRDHHTGPVHIAAPRAH